MGTDLDPNNRALPSARATHEPSQQAVSAVPVGVPNAIEDFARWLESGGGDNSAFALNQSICCSGQDCGCRGSSVGEYLAYEFREFGKSIAPPDPEMIERLRIMAKQRKSSQMDEYDKENADWQYAYDWFCDESRVIYQSLTRGAKP